MGDICCFLSDLYQSYNRPLHNSCGFSCITEELMKIKSCQLVNLSTCQREGIVEGGGVKNPQNLVNVVCEWPLRRSLYVNKGAKINFLYGEGDQR